MPNTSRVESGRLDVVVGVDGSSASVHAVRYAQAEARRLGAALRVVHVLPDYAAMTYPMPALEITDGGRAILQSVLAQVGALDGEVADVVVHTALRHGGRVASLIADARTSHVLVVGSDRRALLGRLLTGNTSAGVAARSVAPVVSVPETWDPSDRGVVLVGVKNPAGAAVLLGEAFAVAAARGSRLRVLHAWQLPAKHGVVVSDDTIADRDEQARRELVSAVAEWRTTYPDTGVDVEAVHDQPAHALVQASVQVDELVIVRRERGFPPAAHLGSTARTVLREAACPVRVVRPTDTTTSPTLEMTGAGARRD